VVVRSSEVRHGHIHTDRHFSRRPTVNSFSSIALVSTLVATLSACAGLSSSGSMAKPFVQVGLPDVVKVPAGNRVAMETVGIGEITYECRAKADMAGAFEWVFVGPQAELMSRSGAKPGSY
jgi:hypothetical protein